jgi:hypothetical protein
VSDVVRRDCSICSRPDVAEVNYARLHDRLSFNSICERFQLAKGTVLRHFEHASESAPEPELGCGPSVIPAPAVSGAPLLLGREVVVAPPPPPRAVRRCVVCPSKHRTAIEAGLVGNVGAEALEARYGLSAEAIQRHRRECIPSALERTQVLATARTVAERIAGLLDEADQFLTTARDEGDLKAWGVAVARLEGAIRLYGQFTGEIGGDPDAAILASAKWREIKLVLGEALKPFPDALEAVVRAFERLKG